MPLVEYLHRRVFGTLGSVLRSNSIEREELAERKILLEDKNLKSWFVYVVPMLSQYNLPSIIDLLSTEISKEAWKQTVDKHVSANWVDNIKLEASERSSLKFLITQNNKIGEVIVFGKVQALTLWQSRMQASKKNLSQAHMIYSQIVPNSISILSTQRVCCVVMTPRI